MRLSLRYKAALLIAATELALLALLLLTNAYQSRRDFEGELRAHAQATAELLAASAREPVLAYDLAQLHNLLQGIIDKHRVRYAAITDHRGRMLAQAGIQLGPEQAVEARHPITVADTPFGEVVLGVSRAETEAALRQTTRSNLIIAGIEVVLVAAISLTLGWFLTRDLARLARTAQALGRGDYAARVRVTGTDEVADLGRSFNGMAEELDRHTAALARSERRFRDLADNTADWLWETDADGRYTYVSNRAQALLGYAPEELVGRSAFELMQRDDAKRLAGLFQSTRDQRRPFYGFEYRASHRDGTVVTLEANGTPILADDGALVGYRGVLATDTRRSLGARHDQPASDGARRLTVVVPAKDEGARIQATVTRVRDELADLDVEVLVVDDGSSDDTAGAAARAGARVVRHEVNRGKGAAVRTGVLAADGRTVAFLDADLAYPPAQVRPLLAAIEDGWDVAVGDRFHPRSVVEGRTRLRFVAGRLFNALTATVLLGQYRDTQCGCKAFRSDVARSLFGRARLDGFAFDVEILHLVERDRLSLLEVPVTLAEAGPSSVRLVRATVEMLRDLLRVRRWSAGGVYDREPA